MARRAARIVAIAASTLPPVYATANYGLTFRAPPGTTYCPLPPDWVGSDHGTTLFLERPRSCGGVGYPSNSRSFEPDVARIELYYGYVTGETPRPLPRCPGGRVRFVGSLRPICMNRDGATVRISLENRYVSDRNMERHGFPSELVLTLVTRPGRLGRDLVVFRRLATTLRTCSSLWPKANGHPAYLVGVGPRCPHTGTF